MLDKSQRKSLSKNTHSNTSKSEIAKFNSLAEQWWDPEGKYKTALLFNRARVSYILPQIAHHFSRDPSDVNCLQGLRILDLGCGGGLICEALAAEGASVMGIDASEMSIEVAKRHAKQSNLIIDYQHKLSNELLEQKLSFDAVINAEVIEHVPNQEQLVKECCELVERDGILVMATLNRTFLSWLIAIIGAEYVMNYLPKGTHDWKMFVKPQELINMAHSHGFDLHSSKGMTFNPLLQQWKLCQNQAVNYIQCFKRHK